MRSRTARRLSRTCSRAAEGAVWFHRASAFGWTVLGPLAFAFGWQDSIWLLWIASDYANVKSDIAAANAADDRRILAALGEVLAGQAAIRDELAQLRRDLAKADS